MGKTNERTQMSARYTRNDAPAVNFTKSGASSDVMDVLPRE